MSAGYYSSYSGTSLAFIGGAFACSYYCEPPPPYLPPDQRPAYRGPVYPPQVRPHKLSSAQLEPPRPPAPAPIRIPCQRPTQKPKFFHSIKSGRNLRKHFNRQNSGYRK